MSIRRLFNHTVRVYREPDAQAARDSLGGVASRPQAVGPVPTGYNARPNQAWTGSQVDRGPGEQQAGRRLWFLDADLDVAERDVLQVLAGPEGDGQLLRVISAVPVSTRRSVHHWEVNTELWVGEVDDYYEPAPEPEPVDPHPAHYVAFNGLVGSLEAKAFTVNADDSICVYCGNGQVWRASGGEANDGHEFDLVATLPSAINWAIRLPDGSLLAGLGNGEVHRSTDHGFNWALRSTIPAGGVREGALRRTLAGTILVGANNGHIYRSTDGAQTWADIGVIGGASNVRELLVLDTGRVLAGLSLAAPGNSIYYSDDDGQTWNPSTPPGVNRTEHVMVLVQAQDGSVIAHGSSDTDLWRSTDRGLTWVVQESGAASGVLILAAVCLSETGTLLTAGTSESTGGPQVRRSVDMGVSFTPTHGGGQLANRKLTGGENTRAFVETPIFGAVLVAHQSTRPVWRSADDGDNWQDPTT